MVEAQAQTIERKVEAEVAPVRTCVIKCAVELSADEITSNVGLDAFDLLLDDAIDANRGKVQKMCKKVSRAIPYLKHASSAHSLYTGYSCVDTCTD